ncbi:hypothetical protein Pyn_23481 [Prunus yedoensis var. nudiflora]|uniref:Uncharacterized protein n=1 Tax=Prunus yedoensis var. nudiflora TaxID=2094558 RepID=A0A314ZJS8_PRUYE|nr:hypothetical protein Pyn_23481 [Prunus yedoensis var. nudiflora]
MGDVVSGKLEWVFDYEDIDIHSSQGYFHIESIIEGKDMNVDDPEAPASEDDMDLSDNNGDEGEDDTEDERAGGDGSGSNNGGGDEDGFNSSFNGGLMSLLITLNVAAYLL